MFVKQKPARIRRVFFIQLIGVFHLFCMVFLAVLTDIYLVYTYSYKYLNTSHYIF
jgi:hypothetical protein